MDLTLYHAGVHGDTSATFLMPEVDEQGLELVGVAREALERGISACGPGKKLNGIGKVIE